MGAVNSPRFQWKAGQRPMGAGAGLHLQWKDRPESWWGVHPPAVLTKE